MSTWWRKGRTMDSSERLSVRRSWLRIPLSGIELRSRILLMSELLNFQRAFASAELEISSMIATSQGAPRFGKTYAAIRWVRF
jgi:hypothetical protein